MVLVAFVSLDSKMIWGASWFTVYHHTKWHVINFSNSSTQQRSPPVGCNRLCRATLFPSKHLSAFWYDKMEYRICSFMVKASRWKASFTFTRPKGPRKSAECVNLRGEITIKWHRWISEQHRRKVVYLFRYAPLCKTERKCENGVKGKKDSVMKKVEISWARWQWRKEERKRDVNESNGTEKIMLWSKWKKAENVLRLELS